MMGHHRISILQSERAGVWSLWTYHRGVIILLFAIGLETNLRQLLQVGGAASVVALVGVALPFVFGYAVCWMLRFDTLVAVVAGATLTATSVSITARVLADLGRLQAPESPIILDAAVLDDDNR